MHLLLCFCLLLWPAAAMALDCGQKTTPTKITIQTNESPVRYDFSQNRAQLNSMGQEVLAASIGGAVASHVGGLTNGTITSNMATQIQTLTAPDGQACVWVSEIQVSLKYTPVVYVSREFPQGSCFHTAVLEHEQKHVAVDRFLLQQFRPDVERWLGELAQESGRRGPVPAGMVQATGREMQQILEQRMNQLMDNLTTVREGRQAQIDTAQEYLRVQNLCVNWP
jgi:hypothetical protein